MSHLDVETGTVVTAGQRTAATADDWAAWGSDARGAFDEARGQVRSAVLQAALEEYAGDVTQAAGQIGPRVSVLGTNTTSAGNTVVNADGEGADLLERHGRAVAGGSGALSRPIAF